MADPTPTRPTDPLLSVIVTIVNGGVFVRDILRAIHAMQDAPPLQVIVPYDESVADVAQYAAEFPDVTFLEMGRVTPKRPITTQAGQHELFDRRRAAGLKIAKGELIAILEDRGFPREDWARAIVRQHAQRPNKVIGGAVECRDGETTMNWAFYVCEFSRYSRPLPTGPVQWVTDINVSYKRAAIDETAHLWKERYQEPVVHWHLIESGEELVLSDEIVVIHRRDPLTFATLLPERLDWGRLFGHIRAEHIGLGKRIALIAASPLIVGVLYVRHGRNQARRGNLGRYLRATPQILVMLGGWTAGEVWGYITRRS